MHWFFTALKNGTNFHWRSPRREFWWFWAATAALFLLILGLEFALGLTRLRLSSLFAVAMLLPGFAVTVRRLHDTDRSGLWALLLLIPIIGWIAIAIMASTPGVPDENEFGPDPRRARPMPLLPR